MLVQGVGATGLFASRAFLPAFAAALMMRFGPEWGIIPDWGLLGTLGVAPGPTWFTSDWAIITLGVLSALEVMANENADARALLNGIDQYAKPVMAALTYLGIATVADEAAVHDLIERGDDGAVLHGAAPLLAGWTTEMVVAPLVAAGTLVIAQSRAAVLDLFIEADEDDATGVQRLLAWAENIWAFFGVAFLILFPFVMLVLTALVSGLILLLRRRVEKAEERAKTDCVNCGHGMYQSAVACPQCGTANSDIKSLGWLGATKVDRPAEDVAGQPYRLAAAKRCPVCAERLHERRPHQVCPACGHETFSEPGFAEAYVGRLAARLPMVLAVCAGLSLLPVIGLIPGIIYYRLALIAPMRRYIPRGKNLLMKWGIRLLFVVLIALQWVPGLGGFVVPAMAAVSFAAYRRLFLNMVHERVE